MSGCEQNSCFHFVNRRRFALKVDFHIVYSQELQYVHSHLNVTVKKKKMQTPNSMRIVIVTANALVSAIFGYPYVPFEWVCTDGGNTIFVPTLQMIILFANCQVVNRRNEFANVKVFFPWYGTFATVIGGTKGEFCNQCSRNRLSKCALWSVQNSRIFSSPTVTTEKNPLMGEPDSFGWRMGPQWSQNFSCCMCVLLRHLTTRAVFKIRFSAGCDTLIYILTNSFFPIQSSEYF